MKLQLVLQLLASPALGLPSTAAPAAAAAALKIHLCGDSTMARTSGNTQGWGEYLRYSFDASSATVSNRAIGGRSARSFTREGRFDEVGREVKAGDWVIIEFGHNDGGSLNNDNGRSDCFGAGSETCQTTYKYVAPFLVSFLSLLLKGGASDGYDGKVR
jgi:rhamnogalacturonan acetylesterase